MFATLILKIVKKLLQISGRGRGTALPGLIGEKYLYKSLSKLPKQLEQIVIITGTNGKTTTSKIIRSILKQNKVKVLSNVSGANLTRGILASLAFDTNWRGKLKSKVAVFEVEEASMAKTVELLNPHIAVVTNLFRDQMDAYGELDHTREVIEKGLEKMSKSSVILLNANDPRVVYMSRVCKGDVKYYGLDDINIPTDTENSAPDSTKSPDERSELEYSKIFYSHMGLFKSKDGKFKTPKMTYTIRDYKVENDEHNLPKVSFKLTNLNKLSGRNRNSVEVEDFKLIGIYNVINCLAAYGVIDNLYSTDLQRGDKPMNISNVEINRGDYSKISAAFGRGEKITLKNNNTITLLLVKNPTGFNSALSAINDIKDKYILFALNDNTADGKDVSWIWDCNFEALKDYKKVIVSGKRGADLALRCKYAEIPAALVEDYENIISEFIDYKDEDGYIKSKKNLDIYALCSYTALLEFRKYLSTVAKVKHIEEEI